MKPRVAVLGGGIGGMSAALRLRAAGLEVQLFEKEEELGGKMGRLQVEGYTWDTGPSVITLRPVLEELFAAAGARLEDHVELLPIEPSTRYFHADGEVMDVHGQGEPLRMRRGKLQAGELEDYGSFLRHVARLYRVTAPTFIEGDPPSWRSLLSVPPTELLRIDALRSMDRALRARVRSPRLRQLLGRFATYVGASPFRAPATLNVIAHVELGMGVWYPRGGVAALAGALGELCRRRGVQVHTATEVEKLVSRGRRIAGLRLRGGREVDADAVVVNADVTTAMHHLLPAEVVAPRQRRRLAAREPSSSALVFHWGVRGRQPALAHHNIFFSHDSAREFSALDAGRIPEDPTVYVAITSKTDAEHAPPDAENWFVLVNAPALGPGGEGASEDGVRDAVLRRLREAGLDVAGDIVVERIARPIDFARRTASWRGALYGPSSSSRWAAFRRPHNRSSALKGLYFAGGSTHPGGGVPMVALSGAVAARLLLRDHGLPVPAPSR